jgi:hypothetical protein
MAINETLLFPMERHRSVRLAWSVDEHRVPAALAFLAVTRFTILRVDGGALCGRFAAWRQTFAVRSDAYVPKRKFGLADRLAEPGQIGGLRESRAGRDTGRWI